MLFLLIVFESGVFAQETMTITGTVTSGGAVKPGLEVTLNTVSDEQVTQIASTVTDSSGGYSFDIEPGTYLVNVTFRTSHYHSMATHQNPVADFELSGIIEGRVNHAQGNDVSDIQVNLLSSFNLVSDTAVTDESGYFTFSDVNLAEYTVQAQYMWVGYSENLLVNTTPVSVNITIFDSTTDDSNIQVVADHIILGQDMNGPWVQEYVQFMNMGNMTYYGQEGVYVGIGTPLQIKNLETDVMDCCMVNEDRRVWVDPMEPMLPGDTLETTISYYLDTDEKEYTFEKDVLYFSMYLMVFGDVDSGIEISSLFREVGRESMNGRNYHVLRYPHPSRDDTITFTVSGYTLPDKNNAGEKDWIVYLLLGLAIIGLLAYPALSRPKREIAQVRKINYPGVDYQDATDIQHMTMEELETEKLRIFEKLHTLDYQLKDGQVSEDEYDEYRAAYKNSAMEIIRQLNEAEAGYSETIVRELDLSGPVRELINKIKAMEDVDILSSAREQEQEGRNRKTLISALDARIHELESRNT